MHRFYIEETIGVSIIDSIPHCHTEKGAKARNVASFLYSGKMEYLSSIVFHTVILKCSENGQKLVNYASLLYRRKKLEYLSSIVFHTVILEIL